MQYTDIWMDTRSATEGSLFICSKGATFNSHSAIPALISAGVKAIVITQDISDDLYQQASLCDIEIIERIGDPLQTVIDDYVDRVYPMQPCVIAVTGTDGKSSTVHYCRLLAREVGLSAATIGTLGLVSDVVLPPRYKTDSGMTTPDRITLRQWLHHLAEAGVTHAFVEYSSIGIHQGRMRGVDVFGAVWTTQGTDHLDYHGTMDAYLGEKKKLFTQIVDVDGFSLLHSSVTAIDDNQCRSGVVSRCDTPRMYYQAGSGYVMEYLGHGVQTSLHASYHIYNLGIALECLRLLGYDYDFSEVIRTIAPPCGRFDSIGGGDQPLVIIDYAHTSDALENVLQAARDITPDDGQLIVVFGCGGDRDTTKRAPMGQIAVRMADRIIVTDDNPRTEYPDAIRAQILSDMSEEQRDRVVEMGDRKVAIQAAVQTARPGDVILIAGKGHEDYQIIGTTKHHFSDHEVVKGVLNSQE